jgi:hypothetical protein
MQERLRLRGIVTAESASSTAGRPRFDVWQANPDRTQSSVRIG